MKENELRIGNYVYPFDDIHLVDEKTIFRDLIKVIYKDFKNTNSLHPIPLTEEWLLKFGFKKDIDNSYQKNDISIFLDKRFNSNIYLQTNDSYKKFEWFGYECKVKYVHQLQNLYFALTNNELTL